MPTVIDDQVAAQLNTRSATQVQNFGEAVSRGILRQSDNADELARQAVLGMILDNRLITALNAREIVMAADPGTNADITAGMALKGAPPYWPQAGPVAAPGAAGGAGGAKAGSSA